MIAQILVADDNNDIATLLKEYLTTRKHRVIIVNDGFQLAAKAQEHKPHLIITDVQMPGGYGNTVYQVLQKDPLTASIPVIFMSAHPFDKLKAILPNDPKTRYIGKPVVFPKLDELIAELLPMGGYIP